MTDGLGWIRNHDEWDISVGASNDRKFICIYGWCVTVTNLFFLLVLFWTQVFKDCVNTIDNITNVCVFLISQQPRACNTCSLPFFFLLSRSKQSFLCLFYFSKGMGKGWVTLWFLWLRRQPPYYFASKTIRILKKSTKILNSKLFLQKLNLLHHSPPHPHPSPPLI